MQAQRDLLKGLLELNVPSSVNREAPNEESDEHGEAPEGIGLRDELSD
jgi:hypothetical protein